MSKLSALLTSWYVDNDISMPWRMHSDPYKIWISEIMLQQTQVLTVIPYYNRWINKYSSIEDLIKADLDDLLKLWEGLGYYSRVKNIYKATQVIHTQYNNLLPESYNDLLKLPGIGDYTASAILSIAFNKPFPSIDGNLKRVLTRIYAINQKDQKNLTLYKKYVKKFYKNHKPEIINQALMDLGREVCTFKSPKCNMCPAQNHCIAFTGNTINLYSVIKKKKTIPSYHVVVGIIFKDNKFLISQRKSTGLLANLWELPGGKKLKNETVINCLKREIREETNISVKKPVYIGNVKHAYSHLKVNIDFYSCYYNKGEAKALDSQQIKWIYKKDINKFTFPTATHKLFQLLNNKNEHFI